MIKLFYTVEIELDFFDENDGSLTGNKTVNVYTIVNNDMVKLTDLDLTMECNSELAIQDWLNDNGYGDEILQIIRL